MSRAYLGRLETGGVNYLEEIRAGLDFVGFGAAIPSQARVFVKPNLTFPSFRPGVMTAPAAIEALILALRDYTPNIWLGDGDSGGYNRFSMKGVYAATGIDEFARRHGATLVNLSELPRTTTVLECSTRSVAVGLPSLLVDGIDVLITMPVPKMHLNTTVSLTFKNQWGCIPEPRDRLKLHPYFREVVFALNQAVHARFAVIDGQFGLNRSGPMLGDVVELGWLAVTDGLGVGARLACELMQVDLDSVSHLRYARRMGAVPELTGIELNTDLSSFCGPKFTLSRRWTDLPGYLAFRSPTLARLAYFSPYSTRLHTMLDRVRRPFYDYDPPILEEPTAVWRAGVVVGQRRRWRSR